APQAHGVLRPLPDAQRGRARPAAHLVGEHLVERHVHLGRARALADQLPVVLEPALPELLGARQQLPGVRFVGAVAHARSRGRPSVTARRTATATEAASKPISSASGRSCSWMRWASSASEAAAGAPSSARTMSVSASGGSRKKSPLTSTFCRRPSSTTRSTTTSLPPGVLYSPWDAMPR